MNANIPNVPRPSAMKRLKWLAIVFILGVLTWAGWNYWNTQAIHGKTISESQLQNAQPSNPTPELSSALDVESFFTEQLNFMADQLRLALLWQPDSALAPAIAGRMQVLCLRHVQFPLASRVLPQVQKLQTDLAMLPSMDMVSLRNQLSDLQTKVSYLDAKLRPIDEPEHQPMPISGSWWHAFWQHVQQLIVIRYHKERPEPLLSADQSLYLKLNLQLLITQTGVAIAGHDWALAAQNLQTLRQQLQSYYDLSESNGKQCMELSGVLLARVQQMQQPQALNLIQQDLDTITLTLQASPLKQTTTGK